MNFVACRRRHRRQRWVISEGGQTVRGRSTHPRSGAVRPHRQFCASGFAPVLVGGAARSKRAPPPRRCNTVSGACSRSVPRASYAGAMSMRCAGESLFLPSCQGATAALPRVDETIPPAWPIAEDFFVRGGGQARNRNRAAACGAGDSIDRERLTAFGICIGVVYESLPAIICLARFACGCSAAACRPRG